MFSIIIPTLNEENNIEEVIKQFSLIKSKYNIEIIVSDSGSADQTVDIAKKYCDRVVLYPYNDCNISKARNYGAKYAQNDVLVFLDADIFIDNIIGNFSNINWRYRWNDCCVGNKIIIYLANR